MTLVVAGLLNKQVGGELGISEITVKAHRGRVMQKMKAGSLADLVNMAANLRLTGGDSGLRDEPVSALMRRRYSGSIMTGEILHVVADKSPAVEGSQLPGG